MPELPEVETIVRELREANLIGLTIVKVKVFWERSIAHESKEAFAQRITGCTILDIQRRGKFIVFSLSKGPLLVHLRMTGKFLFIEEPSSHERVRLYLSDQRILSYEDQRKFGKWYFADADKLLEKIGLEPLSPQFTLMTFKALLKGKKRQIKPFLLDQHNIAGLGNIYTDEALWLAKIHPMRALHTLSKEEIAHLHHAIVEVLKKGIANIGTSLGSARANYFSVSGRRGTHQHQLNVFRQNGLPCARCGTIIQKMKVGQRGTHFCPHCQL